MRRCVLSRNLRNEEAIDRDWAASAIGERQRERERDVHTARSRLTTHFIFVTNNNAKKRVAPFDGVYFVNVKS